jgi:hypothetical protein
LAVCPPVGFDKGLARLSCLDPFLVKKDFLHSVLLILHLSHLVELLLIGALRGMRKTMAVVARLMHVLLAARFKLSRKNFLSLVFVLNLVCNLEIGSYDLAFSWVEINFLVRLLDVSLFKNAVVTIFYLRVQGVCNAKPVI